MSLTMPSTHPIWWRQRRTLLLALGAMGALAAASLLLARNDSGKPLLEIWKDPNCGCCHSGVEHLQANGFAVQVHDAGNTGARKRLGMPEA